MSLDDAPRGWAGGGGWEPYDEPPPPKPPKKKPPAKPPRKKVSKDPPGRETPRPRRPMSGLVAGRFDPPHVGHRFLIDFARASAAQLSVAVFSRSDDRLPSALRAAWLRETFPGVQVLEVPAESKAVDDAEKIAQLIVGAIGAPVRCLYSSEDSGGALAEALGASHVLVDPERCTVPISATALFEDPIVHFDWLLPVSRASVVRRVCISGVGGAGKTTLARELAARYETSFVPEYARTFNENVHRPRAEDVSMIADRQLRSEDAAAPLANRVLFCDTGPAQIVGWASRLFGEVPSWVLTEARAARYDLHLLVEPDRWTPESQEDHALLCRQLEAGSAAMVRLGRPTPARLEAAAKAVDALLLDRSFLSTWAQR